jgi:hypothetical protein
MPVFKDHVSFGDELLKAARRRVADIGSHDLSDFEIDELAARYLQTHPSSLNAKPIAAAAPLGSLEWTELYRDTKFSVESVNRKLGVMEGKVAALSRNMMGSLLEMQRETDSLLSEVSEQSIRINGNYDLVHLNSAVRGMDMPLPQNDDSWNKDFKTEYELPAESGMAVMPSNGFTLPIRESVSVPIVDAVVIDEKTDVGESVQPLVSNSPKNVFLPNRVFRHVIARASHDDSARLYKEKTSQDEYPYSCTASCTVQIELPGSIAVNRVDIVPAGASALSVSKIEYVNQAGEEVELTTSVLSSDTGLVVLFSPIFAKYLSVTFEQYAPVTREPVDIEDPRESFMVSFLEGAGFSTRLASSSQNVSGRVYDFSIESISVSFVKYRNFGAFRSHALSVNSPLGLDLSVDVEAILPPSERDAYGNVVTLPEGRVLYESYIGAELKASDGRDRLNTLIPVPDTYPWQVEFLAPIGAEAKVKLFPDLRWEIDKSFLNYAADRFGSWVIFNTKEAHGLSVGDTIQIVAPLDSGVSGSYEVAQVLADDSFTVLITAFDSPPTYYVFDDSQAYFFTEVPDDPIEVYDGTSLLIFGSDYEISLDAGTTWHSVWPVSGSYEYLYRSALAGNFRIKFADKNPASLYWIKYRVLPNQKLIPDGKCFLKNGHVMFAPWTEAVQGTFSTVILFRTNTLHPYVTSILREYSLRVQEYKANKRFFSLPMKRRLIARKTRRGLNVTQRH